MLNRGGWQWAISSLGRNAGTLTQAPQPSPPPAIAAMLPLPGPRMWTPSSAPVDSTRLSMPSTWGCLRRCRAGRHRCGHARNRRRTKWFQVASLATAALSLGGPLSEGVGTATKLTLALMRLVAASMFVAALGPVIRRKAQPTAIGLPPEDTTFDTERNVARISGRPEEQDPADRKHPDLPQ